VGRGTGRCPTLASGCPPHLIPTCSGSQLSLANCMVAPLPCHVIILPLRNLSWVVPDQSLSRTVRVAVKPSDEPLRKGETVKARRSVHHSAPHHHSTINDHCEDAILASKLRRYGNSGNAPGATGSGVNQLGSSLGPLGAGPPDNKG